MHVVLVLAALAVGQPVPRGAILLDRVAAVVDREVITLSDVERAARVQLARGGAGAAAAQLPVGPDLLDAVLNLLVAQELVIQDARRTGETPDAEDETRRLAAAFRVRFPAREDHDGFLRALGFVEATWLDWLRREAQVELVLRAQMTSTTVTDDEAAALVRQVPELRDLSPEQATQRARELLVARAREQAAAAYMARLQAAATIRVPPPPGHPGGGASP